MPPRAFMRRYFRQLRQSVAVMFRLERPFDRDADVIRLLLAELGELHPKLVEVERGDLFVEMLGQHVDVVLDRKSTRLNSSHVVISYAVFCLKKTTSLY